MRVIFYSSQQRSVFGYFALLHNETLSSLELKELSDDRRSETESVIGYKKYIDL